MCKRPTAKIGSGPAAITTSGKEGLMKTRHFPYKDERDVRSRPHPCIIVKVLTYMYYYLDNSDSVLGGY